MSNANAGTGKINGERSIQDKLLDVNETAARLNVKSKTLREWIKSGHFSPVIRLGPGGRGIIRIRPQALDEFIKANEKN